MKILVPNYTFNKTAKTVTFTDYVSIALENVLLITNVTDGITIYQFNEPALGGTVATNVLTLEYDTSAMDNADDLQIWYDDPNATQEVSATNLDIRDLSQTSDSVAIYGSDDGGTTKRIIKTDAGGAIQVDLEVASVTVTSSALPTGASTSANQTNGSQKSQIVDSAGDSTDVVALNAGLSGTDKGLVTNTVIHGLSTAGGGTYVDVKVDPSGSIQTTANQDTHDDLNANANMQVANTDVSNANPVPISDAGGSITVDGTVAATQSGTWNINNVSGTVSLPTGAATAANQSTIIGHLDGVEGLLTTIDTDTGNIATSTASIDSKTPALGQALASASVPVVLTAAQLSTLTPPAAITGFATETTLAALNAKVTAVNTGAVVVSSSALPSGAATAANQSSELTLIGAVNETAPASDTASSGLNGRLQRIAQRITSLIALVPTALTAGGNFKVAIQEALVAGTNYIGKTRLTDGTTDAEVVPLAGYNAQAVAIVDTSGNQIASFGGGTQYPDGASAATPTGTQANWNESGTQRAVSLTKALPVQPGTSTLWSMQGDVAHDGVNSGNPVQIGVEAIAHGTNPTAVAAGDRTKLYANRAGVPFVMAGHPNIVTVRAQYTAAQTNTAIVSVSAGTKIVVTKASVTTNALNPNIIGVIIGLGTSTTPTTTGVILSEPAMIPGDKAKEGNGSGIIGIGADDADVRITCDDPGSGGEIDVVITYYTIES